MKMINVDPKVLDKLFKDLEDYSAACRVKWKQEAEDKKAFYEKIQNMTEEELREKYPDIYAHLEYLKNRRSFWKRFCDFFRNVIS